MVYNKFNHENNAICILSLSIEDDSAILIGQGNYNRFPTANFIIQVTEVDGDGNVIARENILIATRSGSTFNVASGGRAYEPVPIDDDATSSIQQALPFNGGVAIIENVMSTAVIEDVQNEITRIADVALPLKLDKSVYDAEKTPLIATSTWSDDYVVTSADITAYNNGQTIKVQADVANTGGATLKINALAAKTIKKLSSGAFVPLETGDIIASQIFWATYNSVLDIYQFSVDPATATVADVTKLTNNTYPNGEDVTTGEPLFIETVTPYASATTFGNIGDVNGNKRVSFPAFGSGVSGSTLALALKRVLSTTVDLTVRIETDNAGSPSGTLAHANATTTIPRASMLTAPTSANDDAVTTSSGGDDTASAGYRIYTNYTSRLTTVNLSASCTATRVRLFSDGGSLLATATVTAFVATFNYVLLAWTYYRIEADNNGASYTLRDWGGAWAPRNRTNINYISASLNQSATAYTGNSWNIHSIDTVGGFENTVTFPGAFTLTSGVRYHVNVVSGTYWSENVDATNYYQIGYSTNHTTTRGTKNWDGSVWGAFANTKFPYVSSGLFTNDVLSKTSATYSYKVNFFGFASETKTVWQFPKITFGGIATLSGLTKDAEYFLANTAGTIGTSPGTNGKRIGRALSTTLFEIEKIPVLWTAVNGASSGTAATDLFITAYGSGTSGQTILGTSNGNTLQSIVGTTAGGTTTHSICFPVKKGASWSVTGTMTISTSNIWQTPLS